MNLTPERLKKLVELAFTLEPLLDKPGCSTRYQDLPNKPIYDFIIAGINSADIFGEFTTEYLENSANSFIFSHFQAALEASNEYKANKYINVGLLEFMFIAVKARIQSKTLGECLENLKKIIINSDNTDVHYLYMAYMTALETSSNSEKKQIWESIHGKYIDQPSLFAYFQKLNDEFKDKSTSHFQVSKEYISGFPIIKQFVNEVDDKVGLIKSIERTYTKIHSSRPEIKIGILADFSAAAMFIYLSFQDPSNYIIK